MRPASPARSARTRLQAPAHCFRRSADGHSWEKLRKYQLKGCEAGGIPRVFNKPRLAVCFVLMLAAGMPFLDAGSRVEPGDELFIRHFPAGLEGKRLGLVINQTSLLPDGTSLLERLHADGRIIGAIFTPEHGLDGTAEAGAKIKDGFWKDIPIFSLYGGRAKPSPAQLARIDAFVYDIQDIGTRFYTYISTLKAVLESAAAAGLQVYVLDRPNPGGGTIVEGPLLKEEFRSFIGSFPIPVRYGLTAGELATMMKGEAWVPAGVRLEVVKMRGWSRDMVWSDTGLPWIPTSPNIPTPQAALIYPGTGLVGATNINEGRGTESPFLILGAPWMDAEAIVKDLTAEDLFPVGLEVVVYTPASIPGKAAAPAYLDKPCRGLRITIREGKNFRSVRFALAFLKSLKEHHSGDLRTAPQYMGQMFGNGLLASFLDGKTDWKTLISAMEEEERSFGEKRRPYLLYGF